MDGRIITKLAESNADPDDLDFDTHLQCLRQAHKHEMLAKAYLEQASAPQEYLMYLIAASRLEMDDAQEHPVIIQLMDTVKQLQGQAQQGVWTECLSWKIICNFYSTSVHGQCLIPFYAAIS